MRTAWRVWSHRRVILACVVAGSILVTALVAQSGTDLKVTDAEGVVVNLKQACVDYGRPGMLYVVGTYPRECQGFRVKQGVATVTVSWTRVVKLTVLPPKDEALLGPPRAEVVLVDGKVVTVELVTGSLACETDLGAYKIGLSQVKTIEPVKVPAK